MKSNLSHCAAYKKQRSAIERRCESVSPGVWSDSSNKHNSTRFPDDSPPFFLRRASSSSATDVTTQSKQFTSSEGRTNPYGENMHNEVDSTVRSIIDDLTVENKLLRARNKDFERREKSNQNVDKDKLFEVSLHNISASDAKDLEDVLSAFVRSRNTLHQSPAPQLSRENIQSTLAQMPSHPGLNDNSSTQTHTTSQSPGIHTTQSGASSNRLDSGYASMSMTTGPGSSSLANKASSQRRKPGGPAHVTKRPPLVDVPRGLLPAQTRIISERNKKKMVVQRLEELFTGKRLALASQKSDQDADFSTLADHVKVSAFLEGSREAKIMARDRSPPPKDLPTTASEQSETESGQFSGMESDKDKGKDKDDVPEQRPTRLLDLDPERQQFPAENVDYMRHLGISTPDLQPEDLSEAGPDADGWIYLNLLMNMAQLHIMNVTPDFVRAAVEEVSSKFQLSSDGHRLRWRGGSEPTRLSSLSGSSTTRQSSADTESQGRPADDQAGNGSQRSGDLPYSMPKHVNRARIDNHTSGLLSKRKVERQQERHAAYYSPIFSHPSSDNTDNSDDFGANSFEHAAVGGKRTMPPSTEQPPSAKKRKVTNHGRRGGMVFYNDASFFIDFSGPKHGADRGNLGYIDYYSRDSKSVLGCEDSYDDSDRGSLSSKYLAPRKYWDRAKQKDSILPSPDAVTPSGQDSYFDGDLDSRKEYTDTVMVTPMLRFPVPMEACCLGATTPADHFLQTVTSRLDGPSSRGDIAPSQAPLEDDFTQSSKTGSELESAWERIQVKMADLRAKMQILADFSSRYPNATSMSSPSTVPSASLPTVKEATSPSPVSRKIIDVNYRQLEPSPVPPPALFLSEMSESTEDGSGSSEEALDRLGQDYPYSEPPSSRYGSSLNRRQRYRGANAGGLTRSKENANTANDEGAFKKARGQADSTPESSGVGEEEDYSEESVDMLGFARMADPMGTTMLEKEWLEERARERELDDDEISLQVLGSPDLGDSNGGSGMGTEDSEESGGMDLS